MKLKQVELAYENTRTVVWVPAGLAVKGKQLQRKGDRRAWVVAAVYDVVRESEDILTDWKVGGL